MSIRQPSHSTKSLIREQILQNLPVYFEEREIDQILETMITSRNCIVIFFKDAADAITYTLESKGSIKRLGFKQKLVRLLDEPKSPILAITLNYIRDVDVYKLNENGTDFTRTTIDQSLSSSSSAVSTISSEVSSSSGVAGSSGSSSVVNAPVFNSPTDENYLRAKKFYENVYESLYDRPYPGE